MSGSAGDVVDHLVGIEPGSRLDAIRRMRPEARANSQASYAALFEPVDDSAMSRAERHVVAAFVTGLHGQPGVATFYADALAAHAPERAGVVAAEIAASQARGPYGSYPTGPLSAEDADGPEYRVLPDRAAAIGGRLAAALEHAHMLVFHPRDSSAARLQALLDAGWSTTGVVTLSQLVAFLAFQIRVVAGLRTLAASLAAPAPAPVAVAGE